MQVCSQCKQNTICWKPPGSLTDLHQEVNKHGGTFELPLAFSVRVNTFFLIKDINKRKYLVSYFLDLFAAALYDFAQSHVINVSHPDSPQEDGGLGRGDSSPRLVYDHFWVIIVLVVTVRVVVGEAQVPPPPTPLSEPRNGADSALCSARINHVPIRTGSVNFCVFDVSAFNKKPHSTLLFSLPLSLLPPSQAKLCILPGILVMYVRLSFQPRR